MAEESPKSDAANPPAADSTSATDQPQVTSLESHGCDEDIGRGGALPADPNGPTGTHPEAAARGNCENCDCENCDCENCDCENCDCENCDCENCDCEHSTSEEDASWLEDHAPTVDTPTPEEVVELVVACVHFVRDALGMELDFTPETLPILDHYLLAARETLTERPELRELLWRCAGAYFGELVRRRFNAFWHLPSADVHTWRINQRQVLLSFNPIGVVAEAMAGSPDAEGPTGALRLARADQDEVARRLAEIPPLPEDQYFLLSTRLEVIDTVVEYLRVRMDQNDQADVEFDPDDYANDLAPYGIA